MPSKQPCMAMFCGDKRAGGAFCLAHEAQSRREELVLKRCKRGFKCRKRNCRYRHKALANQEEEDEEDEEEEEEEEKEGKKAESVTESMIKAIETSAELQRLKEVNPVLASSLQTVLSDVKELVSHQPEAHQEEVTVVAEDIQPSFASLSQHTEVPFSCNLGHFTPSPEQKEQKAPVVGFQMQLTTEEDGATICANPTLKEAYEKEFILKVSKALSVPPSRIVVTGIEAGSAVTSYILLDANDPNDPTAEQLAVKLCESLVTNSKELFTKAKKLLAVKETPAYHLFRFEQLLTSATLDSSKLEEEISNLGFSSQFQECRKSIPSCLAKLPQQDVRHKINVDQLACIRLYTMNCLYGEVNRIMRELDIDRLRKYKHFLRFMLVGMYALPETPGQLFRRIGTQREYQVGEIVSFSAWTSCSLGNAVFGGGVEFRISAASRQPTSHGRDISWLSAFPSESEVLVIPHTTFRVTAVTPGTTVIVDMEETTSKLVATPVLFWVDDKPANNASIVDVATKKGVRVVTKLTTRQALQFLDQNANLLSRDHSWFRIISDMGRKEEGPDYVKDAGLRLLRELRKRNHRHPVLIFTGDSNLALQKTVDAEKLGPCVVCCDASQAQEFATFAGVTR